MEVYSHLDKGIEQFREEIAEYAEQAATMNLPYWLIVQDSAPIGIFVVGEEPIQLIASPGTPMALINSLNTEVPETTLELFAIKSLELAKQREVEYALTTFRSDETKGISQFKERGFQEFDDCYKMVRQLDGLHKPSDILHFKQVQRYEMKEFITLAEKFLQGSPDIALTRALEHLLELPEKFLNLYYNQEEFYFAIKGERPVGILNTNKTRGYINNIGIDPRNRGKGYGKQVMYFALEKLRKQGCKTANLRVHVKNQVAIHLYESLGFVKKERYKRLIWWK
ncbi:MAG: GNAT family N-acetyltransferase [Candidatus Bathyarchaeota archaeon]